MIRDRRSYVVVFIGVLAAVLGVIGYAVFGWRFGEDGSTVSTGLGVAVAFIAIVLSIYRYR